MILSLISPATVTLPILLAVAFFTLLERKTLGYMQSRKGPNKIGPHGLFQPLADGVKLFIKEPLQPTTATPILFMTMPIMALLLALIMWSPLPMPFSPLNIHLGLLFLLALSSLTVYSILWSGWASNSKYSLLGALRAAAQTISYEITLGIILLATIMLAGGFSTRALLITQEHTWLITCSWPLAIMWYVSTLAETNRTPFDLTEGESELVSGFNVEYTAGPFALLYLAEYANILLMNTITTILFFGPTITTNENLFPLNLITKACLLSLGFLWARASYPRFRYDQLMHLLWKTFLPLTLALYAWSFSLPIALAGCPPLTT